MKTMKIISEHLWKLPSDIESQASCKQQSKFTFKASNCGVISNQAVPL